MIIVDTELRRRAAEGRPVKVGVFGAGFMALGLVNQILNYAPGLQLTAICNRTLENARNLLSRCGLKADAIAAADDLRTLERAAASGRVAITQEPALLCEAAIDVLVEATGDIEYGAKVTLSAIDAGKDVVSLNTELDGTIGPILKVRADKKGTIVTGCDGDQPGVQMNLFRFVRAIGLKPLLCGNIKGLQDRYRTPTTQAGFAKQWGQTPRMVTSFADGTKISFEQAIVANATGMKVAQRGMIGLDHRGHIDELLSRYDFDRLRALGGVVDYVVGAQPSPGVFILAEAQDDHQRHYLRYMKLGEGPVYNIYVPYHLTIFEIPLSIGRVALLRDVIIAPQGGPIVDVVATAKRPLKAGEVLDGLGGYTVYGQCENHTVVRAENILPVGLAEGCALLRDIAQDEVLSWADVVPPSDRVAHRLRREQDEHFGSQTPAHTNEVV